MTKIPTWAVKQIVRETGIVENVCVHGVGHPTDESAKKVALQHKEWERGHCTKEDVISAWRIHGCDGCCSKKKREGVTGNHGDKVSR